MDLRTGPRLRIVSSQNDEIYFQGGSSAYGESSESPHSSQPQQSQGSRGDASCSRAGEHEGRLRYQASPQIRDHRPRGRLVGLPSMIQSSLLDHKQNVYEKSNASFNTPVNRVFTLGGMGTSDERTIDRAIRRAIDLGMSEQDFRERLGVSSGRFTNWKRRGMPHSQDEKVAKILKWSVDDLLGKPAKLELEPWMLDYLALDPQEKLEVRDLAQFSIKRVKEKRPVRQKAGNK